MDTMCARSTSMRVILGRRRSMKRYSRRRSIPASVRSSGWNGGVGDSDRISRAVASTSISPVGMFAFAAPAGRGDDGARGAQAPLGPHGAHLLEERRVLVAEEPHLASRRAGRAGR